MKDQPTFFDFAAEVGLTKHIGGIAATEALIELCQIGRDSYILDVGCGVGATACFIAKRIGCRVVGVDILERMVERSRQRAKRQKLTHKVEFRMADAQKLPFEDNLFDAVLTESVTAFPEDKQKAVSEYARVTKPGGYVGLNETAWLKVPVPSDVLELLMVGAAVVAQQMPFSLIAAPPSEDILPPEEADVRVIAETAAVVSVGATAAEVVNVISVPYPVPAALVA